MGSICITDFEVSEDANEMTIKTTNISSAGFIRKVDTEMIGDVLHLEFVSAFGGINGNIGAKDEFVISLEDGPKYIAINRGRDKTDYILEKDDKNEWVFIE